MANKHDTYIQDTLFALCIVTLLILATINSSIRALGGSPNLFSPFFVKQKVVALLYYAKHVTSHHKSCKSTYQVLLNQTARQYGVPADFVLRIAQTESAGIPHRISHAGAMGIMQLMPETAHLLGVTDPFDPRQNIEAGVRYLKTLWRRYRGDRLRVAAAYNAGPGAVPRKGSLAHLPLETKAYIQKTVP